MEEAKALQKKKEKKERASEEFICFIWKVVWFVSDDTFLNFFYITATFYRKQALWFTAVYNFEDQSNSI